MSSQPILASTPAPSSSVTSAQPKRAKQIAQTISIFLATYAFFLVLVLSFTLGVKYILNLIIALPVILLATRTSRRGYLYLLYFTCITFIVGQRTVHIGEGIRIVPSEVLLWMLGLLCLGLQSRDPSKGKPMPTSAFFLTMASILGILVAVGNDLDLNAAIGDAKCLWLMIPTFFVCHKLIQRFDQMHNIITILALGTLCLCTFGVAEYHHLGFMNHLDGFLNSQLPLSATPEDFYRARVTFWGGPSIVMMLILFLPVILAHWHNSKTPIQKTLFGSSIASLILMIYYSGYRGVWITTLFAIACFYYLRGVTKLAVLLLAFLVVFPLLPSSAIVRIQTLSGETEDSSAKKRKERAQQTWMLVKESPILGNGWGAAGLSHTELLQYWADSGLLCILAFLALYYKILKRLFIVRRKIPDKTFKTYGEGYISSLLAFTIILATQTMLNLPEQYPPFWLVLALAYRFPAIVLAENATAAKEAVLQAQQPLPKEPRGNQTNA